ncbi:aldolase/citrate lyase family protein [Georgenia yuyongxinii]|uniref:aldolase/citrate lyase family protein n=1 Tax=Georgenia yuyongxinii TaxID=2589797 RepID=UPI0022AB17C9|nr:aldolase/citrate lyase family protein [Georgenia yuyongxinii]
MVEVARPAIADELAAAERDRTTVPPLGGRYPGMTIEDSYAVQNEWRRRAIEAGRRPVGRKIGLTSKVMQAATGIDKKVLDLGAQNLLVPMVSSAAEARAAVEAVRYPPRGRRGVGSALARSARWNRADGYLTDADAHVALFVQIETTEGHGRRRRDRGGRRRGRGLRGAVRPLRVDGAAGRAVPPRGRGRRRPGLRGGARGGKPVVVNAFDPAVARSYLDAGASFVLVWADVALLARSSEALAATFVPAADETAHTSY